MLIRPILIRDIIKEIDKVMIGYLSWNVIGVWYV